MRQRRAIAAIARPYSASPLPAEEYSLAENFHSFSESVGAREVGAPAGKVFAATNSPTIPLPEVSPVYGARNANERGVGRAATRTRLSIGRRKKFLFPARRAAVAFRRPGNGIVAVARRRRRPPPSRRAEPPPAIKSLSTKRLYDFSDLRLLLALLERIPELPYFTLASRNSSISIASDLVSNI